MKNNDDLKRAYNQIRSIYRETNTKPSLLHKVVYTNKWNTVFTNDGYAGIAFNFTGEHAIYGSDIDFKLFEKFKDYIGKDLFKFAEYLLSLNGIQMRSVCLATLNALSQAISSPEQFKNRNIYLSNSKDFNFIEKHDIVTLVGYGGVIDKIYGKCKEFHVLDMRPKSSIQTLIIGKTIKYGPDGIILDSPLRSEEILSKSDIVIMSGCTLVNGTFKEIIKDSKKARVIGMFGPSGQIVPEFLFDEGINYVLSSRIIQTETLYNSLTNPLHSKFKFQSYMEPYIVKSALFPE